MWVTPKKIPINLARDQPQRMVRVHSYWPRSARVINVPRREQDFYGLVFVDVMLVLRQELPAQQLHFVFVFVGSIIVEKLVHFSLVSVSILQMSNFICD